jgi:hypothetical protein
MIWYGEKYHQEREQKMKILLLDHIECLREQESSPITSLHISTSTEQYQSTSTISKFYIFLIPEVGN